MGIKIQEIAYVRFHAPDLDQMETRGFVDAWISQTRERELSLGGSAADDALMQRRLAEAIWLIDVTITRLRNPGGDGARVPVSGSARKGGGRISVGYVPARICPLKVLSSIVPSRTSNTTPMNPGTARYGNGNGTGAINKATRKA